jgi:hypothetical protein
MCLSGEKCLPMTVLTLNQVNVSVWREMSTRDLLTLSLVNVFECREMSTHESCLL